MGAISIGEAARRSGLNASAIRYYEAEGLLPPPSRSSGRRTFSPEEVDRLRVIRTARDLGFSIEDIRTLFEGFGTDTPPAERWRELAARKLPEVDALVQRATAMKRLLLKGLRCNCVTVADCILHDCSPPVQLTRRAPGAAV